MTYLSSCIASSVGRNGDLLEFLYSFFSSLDDFVHKSSRLIHICQFLVNHVSTVHHVIKTFLKLQVFFLCKQTLCWVVSKLRHIGLSRYNIFHKVNALYYMQSLLRVNQLEILCRKLTLHWFSISGINIDWNSALYRHSQATFNQSNQKFDFVISYRLYRCKMHAIIFETINWFWKS